MIDGTRQDRQGQGRHELPSQLADPGPCALPSDGASVDGGTGAEALVADECALVQAVRNGCPDACARLVRQHAAPMRAVAMRLLQDESDADDVVQEAFLSALRAMGSFEGRSSLSTWLHRITTNAALMRLRALSSRPAISVEDLLPVFTTGGAWPQPLEPWADPEQDPVLREELCAHVRECISRLPDKHRIPLLLREIEGLPNDEIARRLGVSVNAAKIRVHRARQAVRALLDPLMLESTP